jgi:hypothetical protein
MKQSLENAGRPTYIWDRKRVGAIHCSNSPAPMSHFIKLEYRVWYPAFAGRIDPIVEIKNAMLLSTTRCE